MELTKIQRNDIFNAVKASGLDPAACELNIIGHEAVVSHAASESIFAIGRRQSDLAYRTRAKVGEEVEWRKSSPPKWRNVLKLIQRWAQQVLRYEGIPDLWVLKIDPSLLEDASQSVENTPFTLDERAQIASKFREIRNYLKTTRSLTEDQLTRVEERLDEAEKASGRIGRKDWALLLWGTVLTLIVTDLIPPDVAQHVLTMALHGLVYLFGGPPHGEGTLAN